MGDGLFGDPKVDEALDALWRVPGWPKDETKDEALVRDLMAKYRYVDLPKEIAAWGRYLQEKEVTPKNWRGTVQTWFRQGRRWGVERRSNRIGSGRSGGRTGSPRIGDSRTSSRAGEVGAFGGRSGRLDDW